MIIREFEFEFRQDGTLTDLATAKFRDPTGTFGIRRQDNSQLILAAGTSFAHPSLGRYEFTADDTTLAVPLVAGETYEAWIEFTYADGGVDRQEVIFVAGVDEANSIYHTYGEFIRRWGSKNVKIASNKDQVTTAADMAAVQQAFDYAAGEIPMTLSGGVVEVPLDLSQNAGVVPSVVKEWAMVIAYENLYNARGLDDKDKVGNKITGLLKRVYLEMGMVRSGLLTLPLVPQTDVEPTVFESEYGYCGYSGCCRYPDQVVVWI